MQELESSIQKSIMAWLERAGIEHWRMALGAVMVRTAGGGKAKTKNPMKGFPDIWGFMPLTERGEIFTIEVKKPKTGRLSKEQIDWQEKLKRRGVFYIEARSVNDVAQAFAKRFG